MQQNCANKPQLAAEDWIRRVQKFGSIIQRSRAYDVMCDANYRTSVPSDEKRKQRRGKDIKTTTILNHKVFIVVD